jgi:acyl-CoA thioester hydrolase
MDAMHRYDYQVSWADLDSNNHLANTAYLDYAAQTRFRFLADHGFPPSAFEQARLGPVVFEDRVTYKRELRLLDMFTVGMELRGQNESGSRFMLVNRFLDAKGELCAEVWTHAAWFNLKERRISDPPAGLLSAMNAMPKDAAFETL